MINVIIFILTIAHCTSAELVFNSPLNQNAPSAQICTTSITRTFREFASKYEKIKSSQHNQCLYSREMDEQTKDAIAECLKAMSTEEVDALKKIR
ncbi:MAG: hypothetical protein V4544_06990 [Pseudomonadota bacterium]